MKVVPVPGGGKTRRIMTKREKLAERKKETARLKRGPPRCEACKVTSTIPNDHPLADYAHEVRARSVLHLHPGLLCYRPPSSGDLMSTLRHFSAPNLHLLRLEHLERRNNIIKAWRTIVAPDGVQLEFGWDPMLHRSSSLIPGRPRAIKTPNLKKKRAQLERHLASVNGTTIKIGGGTLSFGKSPKSRRVIFFHVDGRPVGWAGGRLSPSNKF